MPEDNRMVISQWCTCMQSIIERTSKWFISLHWEKSPGPLWSLFFYHHCLEWTVGTPVTFSEWMNKWTRESKSSKIVKRVNKSNEQVNVAKYTTFCWYLLHLHFEMVHVICNFIVTSEQAAHRTSSFWPIMSEEQRHSFYPVWGCSKAGTE